MLGLIIVAVVVIAGVIAYGLHKKGQKVTAGTVLSTAEADVKADAAKAEAAVANTISSKL
jgi:hypothetical protein